MPLKYTIDTLSDGHVHTRLCNHAKGEMEEYVLSAINRGLKEIIFLEHLETGIDYLERTWLSEDDFDFYFEEGNRLKGKYSGQIRIGTGVEVGYNAESPVELITKLECRTWDRIGISCHFLKLPGTDAHLNLLSKKKRNIDIAIKYGVESILSLYFKTLIEAVEKLPGTVLCHIDAALRFVPGLQFSNAHFQQIDSLLALVKDKGMALEVNTSGFAIRQEPFPTQKILHMAHSHNIPLVAGSDAHKPEDVGNHFDILPEFISSSIVCP
ncbi:histidinol-phosphatase [Desulfosediminicola flagellatus]|uniref:histidinol-phosphatase n=1 Tax=Desulfosediminicola flagellatus TaxID=2569541 RepID=UPI001E4EF3A5|nr:histidinol-phosphatase [Desulfosediminicola flagellatus]